MFQLLFSKNYKSTSTVEEVVDCIEKEQEIELQTSGSTGIPKKLSYPISALKNSARKTNSYFNFNESTKGLLCMNPDTIAGKMMIVRAFEGNYSLLVTNPTGRPLENLTSDIDFIAIVPLQLKESLINDTIKLKSIKTILVGGGPISPELEKLMVDKKITVHHSFGMTETVSHVALRKVGYQSETYFQALPGIHFSSEKGELIIHAPDLGINELYTNDLIELKSATSFKWLGRKDFVINSGGYKIHPELLENSWSKILDCPYFLSKEESDKWGEQVVMYIECNKWPELKKEELLNHFKSYELPKKYYLMEKFVYTASGKINRPQSIVLKSTDCREEAL